MPYKPEDGGRFGLPQPRSYDPGMATQEIHVLRCHICGCTFTGEEKILSDLRKRARESRLDSGHSGVGNTDHRQQGSLLGHASRLKAKDRRFLSRVLHRRSMESTA